MPAKQFFSAPVILVLLVTVLTMTVSLAAQLTPSPAVASARLEGTVLDTMRAAIPGAEVTITPDDQPPSLLGAHG